MNISNFSNQTKKGDYAHSNLFKVILQGDNESEFMIKASSIPATTVGMIEVPYLNRKIKVPGDRTFADWTITVIQDESGSVREKLLEWQAELQQFHSWQSTDKGAPQPAHRTMVVSPMGRTGGQGGKPAVISGWPTEIGAIDLGWETADTIQEYTVTFAVTWSTAA
jgi:hypothetical protein